MKYYAVTRKGTGDELTHWKYIKKIKSKNGKTRYIYDRSELDKYENEVVEEKKNETGGTDTVEYKKSDSLFGEGTRTFTNTTSFLYADSKPITSTKVTKYQGKLDRYYAKGEKFIYDNFYGKNRVTNKIQNNLDKKISSGRKLVNRFFRR